jgi:two-component system OmpR family response regulator
LNLHDYCGNGRVLIADDDAAIRELLRERLAIFGYDVRTCRDGEAVLEALDQFNPHAMILDLSMPKLDGFQVLERIGRARLVSMPVMILTGRTGSADAARAISLGAKDFLKKPFGEMDLVRRVSRLRKWIEHAQAA